MSKVQHLKQMLGDQIRLFELNYEKIYYRGEV